MADEGFRNCWALVSYTGTALQRAPTAVATLIPNEAEKPRWMLVWRLFCL